MIKIDGKKPLPKPITLEVGQVYEATTMTKKRWRVQYQIVIDIPKAENTYAYVVNVGANGQYMGLAHWMHKADRKLVGKFDFNLGDCSINIQLLEQS